MTRCLAPNFFGRSCQCPAETVNGWDDVAEGTESFMEMAWWFIRPIYKAPGSTWCLSFLHKWVLLCLGVVYPPFNYPIKFALSTLIPDETAGNLSSRHGELARAVCPHDSSISRAHILCAATQSRCPRATFTLSEPAAAQTDSLQWSVSSCPPPGRCPLCLQCSM